MSTDPRGTQPPSSAPEEGYAGMPGWVKAFLIAAIVVAVVVVVALLSGGQHGPGRHLSASWSTAVFLDLFTAR